MDWQQLREDEFLFWMQERILQHGNLSDAFPWMVSYNVPLFLIKRFWPEKINKIISSQNFVSFAIAEKGWHGNIKNLKSRLEKNIKQDAQEKRVCYHKSYVMDCDALLIAVRSEGQFAFIWTDAQKEKCAEKSNSQPDCDPMSKLDYQIWCSRNEPDILFQTTDGNIYDHFFVRGREMVDRQRILQIDLKEYKKAALQIPRREISSLAFLALCLLEYHGLAGSKVKDWQDKIVASRSHSYLNNYKKNNSLEKNILGFAKEVINYFNATIKAKGVKNHPFWNRLRM